MTIFAKLGLGFATMLLTFCLVGGLSVTYLGKLRVADAAVRDRVALNEVALAYRHGAQEASLGASQLAAGNVMGEQRVAEGTGLMAQSRTRLAKMLTSEADKRELAELLRVDKLTVSATERVVAAVRAKSPAHLIRQELAFLSARADALNLRLEALFDDTRTEMEASMALSDVLGARVESQTAIALAACLVFSALVSVLVFRSIAPPIARLEQGVKLIASGDMEHTIAVSSEDEVGRLTHAFNEMTAGLRRAMGALDARNRDMRVVLDHVNQGLLTVDRDGIVARERSAMVDRWLGEIAAGSTFWGHLAGMDPAFSAAFKLNWDQLLEDLLPVELTLDQMPRRFAVQGAELELDYRPIFDGEVLTKLLVVISDVSDRIAREKARAHEQEVFAIFQAIQRDKQGFLDFFAEGSELIGALSEVHGKSDLVVIKRQVHTLKGNAAIFGICSVSGTCHHLETRMGDAVLAGASAEGFSGELHGLRERWLELEAVVAKLVGDSSMRIEIGDDEYAEILAGIAGGKSRREIARLMTQWRMERVQPRLERFGDQVRSLAERLGKSPMHICIEAAVPRLPRAAFAPFWGALVHALRNAVDHGLETPDEHKAHGKPGLPGIALRSRVLQDELAIEVYDNGRGIPWARIAEKARERGLPADTEEDLVYALFSDGVSTADAVSEVSGRGVGMAALRDACSRLAGRIVIQSEPGQGTVMSFRFPLSVMLQETEIELESVSNTNSMLPPAEFQGIARGVFG
jgi:two-component system chemotaxis sensor kinase CheA